jgi:hypothetical protein
MPKLNEVELMFNISSPKSIELFSPPSSKGLVVGAAEADSFYLLTGLILPRGDGDSYSNIFF